MAKEENDAGFNAFKRFLDEQMGGEHFRQAQAQSRADGHADVADSIHVLMDEINRSNDLNVASMLCLSKTFEAVFTAFRKEADAQSVHEDPDRKFLMESGIVCSDEGCFHCAPGGVHLHDLQIVAGVSAMRFFLFARLRKIETTLPIIRDIMKSGDLESAARMLNEAMHSASSMMKNLEKLGFSLLDTHPVAIKAKAGAEEAGKLMNEIFGAIKARDGNQ